MDEFRELSLASGALTIAPWILIPSAVGAAWAGIAGRRRLAYGLLALAALAIIVPIVLLLTEVRALD